MPPHRYPSPSSSFLLLLLAALLVACGGGEGETATPATPPSPKAAAPAVETLDSPAPEGSYAPELTRAGDGVILSWLEEVEPESERTARLRWARLGPRGWGAVGEVPVGAQLFANWADRPAVVETAPGELVAHWLQMVGDGTYAYGVAMAHSSDAGASWQEAGWLHEDRSLQEHGFVSWALGSGELWAVWLDGRAMGDGGPMQLRALALDPASPTGEGPDAAGEVLDERVCECCDTDAALGPAGPVVVYRDRSENEVRDVGVVRRTAAGWSEPALIHDDGWVIHGCPVNGPAIAADGERLAVAWFTLGADQVPRVRLAASNDGGRTFAPPVTLAEGEDAGNPLGRIDLVFGPAGNAWVSWLVQRSDDRAEIVLASVDPAGQPGPARVVTETTPSRAAGVPRLERAGDRLVVAWVEAPPDGGSRRVRTAVVPLGQLPSNKAD